MLRIMVIDETPIRSRDLKLVLEGLGYDVVAEINDPRTLHDEVLRLMPDAIIVDTESPHRDTLENLCSLTQSCPRPIVMFSADPRRDSIRKAVSSGVTAYVVDGLEEQRITPIIETAVARFEAHDAVRRELADTKARLSERKLVDRAKGFIMDHRSCSEADAYGALRKMSMEEAVPLGEVARRVIAMADVLKKS
jgi:two-component system, response regulator / RNA-binding antiterminator